MKIYVNREPVNGPWGGGNLWLKALYKTIEKDPNKNHTLIDLGDFNGTPDVILLAGLDNDGLGMSAEQAIMYKMYMKDIKIFLRVNENDARKNTTHVDNQLIKVSHHIDGTVFVSNW